MVNFTCVMCKNYLKDNECKAFPKGIDNSILLGKNDHSKPLKGQDNDIVFTPIKSNGE